MVVIKKRGIWSLIIVILLIIGLVSFTSRSDPNEDLQLAEPTSSDTTSTEIDIAEQIAKSDIKSNFFAEYRLERERLRGKQLELLKEIVNNEANDEKARDAASIRMVEISEDMDKEMKAESLVKSKGYSDCVVILQPQATTIIIQSDNLPLDQEKELRDIVSKVTGVSTDKMSIIVRKPE